MIITNNPHKIKLNQKIYYKIISSIDFNSIPCDSCSHSNWVYHSSYLRFIDFLDHRFKIKIVRVICRHCGKSHAILVEQMIPFSSLSHSDIINVLSHYDTSLVYSSHFYFLKDKYKFLDIYDYLHLCLFNRRSSSILFFST